MTADDRALREALAQGPFALIGAGQLGRLALAMWPARLAPPLLFVDSVAEGSVDGIAVERLSSHRPRVGVTYLLSALKMAPREARALFEAVGQSLPLTVYDLFEEHARGELSNGWRHLNPAAGVTEQCAQVRACLGDDTSQRVFDAVCAWRFRRELTDDLPMGSEDNKYELRQFGLASTHYACVIDGGSYDLSLASTLARSGVQWDEYHAFEPDPVRRRVCECALAAMGSDMEGTGHVHSHALGDRTGTASFLASGLYSARLVRPADFPGRALCKVPMTSLDAACGTVLPSLAASGTRVLLKLHIEGAEPSAVRGARQLLRRAACDVFVNLTHDEESLLSVPLELARLGRHDIYLRAHALCGDGITLFARYRLPPGTA